MSGPGAGRAVLLLHGWPGDRTDYREVVSLVAAEADVIVPDLRGFGESDKHEADPASQYNAVGAGPQPDRADRRAGAGRPVIAGYDIGSRIAQAIARDRPDLVRALVVAPPLPGIGDRILVPQAQREFWYQAFHHLELSTELVDGQPDAVRAYLRHFWSHWSGPGYEPAPATWITWCRSTGRQARSPPRSPGTGRARGRSPPPWRSRSPRTRIAVPPCCGRKRSLFPAMVRPDIEYPDTKARCVEYLNYRGSRERSAACNPRAVNGRHRPDRSRCSIRRPPGDWRPRRSAAQGGHFSPLEARASSPRPYHLAGQGLRTQPGLTALAEDGRTSRCACAEARSNASR